MGILIMSWLWTLLGSSLEIINLILSFTNSIFDRYWLGIELVDEGRTLLFPITELCFARKELKRLALLLKSVASLLSWIIDAMQGIFC